MKLLLFILGIALCTAVPSFRALQGTTVTDKSDFVAVDSFLEDPEADDAFPTWLFADVAANSEEDLGVAPAEEEQLPNNEEESLPEEETLLEKIRKDPVLNDMFNFGIAAVIRGGIVKGKIPSTKFIVANVSDAFTNTSKAGVRYLFSCAAVSENGNSVINMNFTVYYAFSNKQQSLRAYSYSIKTTTPFGIDESKYTDVAQEEIDSNPVIKECLEYAIDEVVKQADQYVIGKITSVKQQTVRGVVYYKYNAELTNNKDKIVELVTTVSYRLGNGEKDVKSYSTKTTTTTTTTVPRN